MIDSLRGTLGMGAGERVLVDVNGVGYGLYVSEKTKAKLPALGSEVSLFVHTYVRENQFDLYAFLTDVDRDIFTFLLKGNGVGPKLALSIVSYYESKDLVDIVQRSRVEMLVQIPGIGKKKAEKLLLDLKDKSKDYFSTLVEESLKKDSKGKGFDEDWLHDLKLALRKLDYKDNDIRMVLRELDLLPKPPKNIQEALQAAMRIFASNSTFIHRRTQHGTTVN